MNTSELTARDQAGAILERKPGVRPSSRAAGQGLAFEPSSILLDYRGPAAPGDGRETVVMPDRPMPRECAEAGSSLARAAIVVAMACSLPCFLSQAFSGEPDALDQDRPSAGLTLDEAVRQTLAHDPNIQLQERQVDIAKGILGIARGQFDPAINGSVSQGVTRVPRSETDRSLGNFPDVLSAVEDVTIARAGLTNQFRSGISVDAGFELDRFEDNLYQNEPANRANVSFVLRVPLLRGAGRVATEAQEQAAQLNQQATVLDLDQEIAVRILNTVSTYWNCRAAEEQLGVFRKSEQGASSLRNVVGQLVGIRELAASELLQAQANEAQKAAAVSAAEQALWQTRQDLAQAIGFALAKMTNPPTAADGFPEAALDQAGRRPDQEQLLARSLERRADFRSSLKAQQGARILEAAARQNAKPQLDLSLEAGYAGLNEGSGFKNYFASLDPRLVSGPNLLGTVSMEWPFGNHAARGLLLERRAEQQQTLLRSQVLERSIRAGILVALKDLEHSRAELESARVAVQNYKRAVDQEVAKMRLRTSTILDVITLGDRMESARLTELAAKARYWIALARCRYETGWLVPANASTRRTITTADLTTLPAWDREEGPRIPR